MENTCVLTAHSDSSHIPLVTWSAGWRARCGRPHDRGVDLWRGNEGYRALAISHYSGEFKEGKEKKEKRTHSLSFKFSAQDMIRKFKDHLSWPLVATKLTQPEIRDRVGSYNLLNHSINWMQSLAMPGMSKPEHLLRKGRILTQDVLVGSDGPDLSASLQSSANPFAGRTSSSLSDETSPDWCGDPLIPSPVKGKGWQCLASALLYCTA